MGNINSVGSSQVQLESLDSMRANNLQARQQQPPPQQDYNNSSGLQSLDSLRANSYSDPNGGIPNEDVLAPIDAMNPEIPNVDPKDNKENFVVGVFKGFGKAGLDTVKGVATLGKLVFAGVTHPKDVANYVGGGISYAVTHPLSAAKKVAIDLPVGIVKGIINPYAEAIKTGKYGQAVGRGVFDVGLILLTAGLGDKAEGSSKAAEGGVEAVTKGSKGSKAAQAAIESVTPAENGAAVIAKTEIKGGVHLAKDAVHDIIKATGKGKNVFNGPVNISINVGGTVVNNTGSAGKLVAESGQVLSGATEAVTKGSKVIGATEALSNSRIAIGLGDLGGTLGNGASKIAKLFKPIGVDVGNALTAVVGPNAAAAIRNGAHVIGNGIAVGGHYVKEGALFVKAHPLPSALLAGKTVDIIDKGLKASDNYDPGDVQYK